MARGTDIMRPVATATAIPASRLHGHHDRPSMVSVGTIIWLSSELMFFAALFASYFTIRAVSEDLWAQNTALLNIPFASVNTTILVLSSLTCQLGVFAAGRVLGDEGLQIATEVAHPGSCMWASYGTGLLALRHGDLPRALPLLEQAMGICQGADFPAFFASTAAAFSVSAT